MKIDPDQPGFELLPFLRSPGGCLVTLFCLLVGGCFCGLVWMNGFNSFTFDCGKGRTIVVYQARENEYVFIHDFRDNRKRSNLAEYYDDPQLNELTRLLNNDPDNPMLRAW